MVKIRRIRIEVEIIRKVQSIMMEPSFCYARSAVQQPRANRTAVLVRGGRRFVSAEPD